MSDHFDLAGYERRVREGPCFVCAFLNGDPDYRHHVVYEDDDTVAFLARYPTLLGHCLVSPKRHIEDWVRELRPAEHLAIQAIVYAVAEALADTLPTSGCTR